MENSLQQHFAPHNACYGCGQANPEGFQLQSFVLPEGNEVIAKWQPKSCHQAFPGILNGGVIGTLLDCHSNWTAAYMLMQARGESSPPCTVTADYHIKLLRPTPFDNNIPVSLTANILSINEKKDKAVIKAKLFFKDKLCATCEGTFVAVQAGHPAYHRW